MEAIAHPHRDGPFQAFPTGAGSFFQLCEIIVEKGITKVDTGAWEKIIKKMCREKGITPKEYAPLITTLAGILEKRDNALDLYEDTGGNPVVRHTNKGGATNIVKNPLLILWDDLNKSALAYWRELGLTPSSYKKVSGDGPTKEKPSGLAAALMQIETD